MVLARSQLFLHDNFGLPWGLVNLCGWKQVLLISKGEPGLHRVGFPEYRGLVHCAGSCPVADPTHRSCLPRCLQQGANRRLWELPTEQVQSDHADERA